MMPRSGNPIVFFAAAISLLTCSVAVAQEPLRWRLAEGEQFVVNVSQTATTTAEIGGRTYESSLHVGLRLNWRVTRVAEDGAAEIEQILSRLAVNAKLPGVEPVRYDSASQEQLTAGGKAIAEEFRPLVGKAVAVRLTPTGEIEEAAADRAAGGEGGAAFTAAEVRRLLGRLLPPLPPDGAAPGEAWSDEQQTQTPHGAVRIEGRYRLRPPEAPNEERSALIDAIYNYESDAQEHGVALTLGDQEITGVFTFDPQPGRLIRSEIRQSLTMQVAVEGAEVEQRVASKTHMTITPAAP